MDARIKLQAPCGHQLRAVELLEYATTQVTRTCSRHHQTWRVLVTPISKDTHKVIHRLNWIEV
jgi:hypothetical protein